MSYFEHQSACNVLNWYCNGVLSWHNGRNFACNVEVNGTKELVRLKEIKVNEYQEFVGAETYVSA